MMNKKGLLRNCLLLVIFLFVFIDLFFISITNGAAINNIRTALKSYGLRMVVDLSSRTDYRVYKDGDMIFIEIYSVVEESVGRKRFPTNRVATYYNVRVSDKNTIIEIKLRNSKIKYSSFTLDDPFRIVVDLIYPDAKYEEYREGPKTEELNISLTEVDIAINSIFGYQDFYFNISSTWKLLPGGFLNLFISHSQITKPKISNIVVYLNGFPIYTIPLDETNLWMTSIRIPIFVSLLRKGVNIIELKSFMRTTEEECMDIDNPGNWLRIHKESYVHLKYLSKEDLSIKDFPSPYFEENVSHRELTAFVLPDNWSPKEVEAIMAIALDWARRASFKKFSPSIFLISELNDEIKSKYNLIYIGKSSSFPTSILDSFGINPEDLKGKFAISSFISSNGKGRLFITSEEESGVLRGARALLLKEVRDQIDGNKVFLPVDIPLPMKEESPEFGTDIYFTDLMLTDIIFRGTYSHADSISFRIPLHWRIKGSPTLVIHFRHSPALDGKKSALTVLINDVPIKAVELNSKNTTDGRLIVPIPYEAIKGDYLIIGFEAHLDINVPDCNHNYSEAAWLVIEKSSYLHIPHDIKAMKPLIENLPFAMVGEKINLYVGRDVNSSALTTLLNCLISWQRNVYYPLEISALDLNSFKVEDFEKKSEHAIILGSPSEINNTGIKLLIDKVPVVPEFAEDTTLWQLNVYGGKNLALVITWLKEPPEQTPFYLKMLSEWALKGDLCFLSSKGEVIPFYIKTPKPPETKESEKSFWEKILSQLRYSRTFIGIFVLAFIGIAAIMVVAIVRNRKRL
ncbi:MAG: cellulose biosynthesis cyclic di-GMP-binding regulatory protein BcsB [Synergistetes bacterium]|nr:cellulose biosynthesis cyclic di-GMP-binding regulatory protein BcsB [Synergistota bacterium]